MMAGIGKQLDGEKNVSASPHGHYEPGQIFGLKPGPEPGPRVGQNLRPDPEPYLSPARVGPGSGLKARPKPGLGLQARPGTSLHRIVLPLPMKMHMGLGHTVPTEYMVS